MHDMQDRAKTHFLNKAFIHDKEKEDFSHI